MKISHREIARYSVLFLTGTVLILVFDALFLGLLFGNIYHSTLGHLYRDNFDLVSALMVYALLCLSILIFGLKNTLQETLTYSPLLGLFVYGVYDFTNYAIFNFWTVQLLVIDVFWGITLFSAISTILFYFSKIFDKKKS